MGVGCEYFVFICVFSLYKVVSLMLGVCRFFFLLQMSSINWILEHYHIKIVCMISYDCLAIDLNESGILSSKRKIGSCFIIHPLHPPSPRAAGIRERGKKWLRKGHFLCMYQTSGRKVMENHDLWNAFRVSPGQSC